MAELENHKDKKVKLQTYNNSNIPQIGMCTVIIKHNNHKSNADFCSPRKWLSTNRNAWL